jgi:thioredoxin-related protein
MKATRRNLILGSTLLGASLGMSRLRAEPVLSDDGLYRQPWFLESFLELADDLQGATKSGKRFAIMWELRGCPYCRETHLVNFARPDIENYVKANFDILQLNIIGARKVTDFDGREISEKALAAKYGIRFTPTLQFFPDNPAGLADQLAEKREVARAAGYLRPDDFLAMFRFVREKEYERRSFRDYVKAMRG